MKRFEIDKHPDVRHKYWALFVSFLKIGVFTFGGGYAMIPLIEREVISRRGWVGKERFLELLTLAQAAPGPISLNTAVFVGYGMGKYRGAVVSLLGVVIPSFIVILLIAIYFADIKDDRLVEALFKGMRPAVVALIVAPVAGLARGMGLYRVGLALLAAAAIWRLGVSPIWLIIAGAAGGILWTVYGRRHKAAMAACRQSESNSSDNIGGDNDVDGTNGAASNADNGAEYGT